MACATDDNCPFGWRRVQPPIPSSPRTLPEPSCVGRGQISGADLNRAIGQLPDHDWQNWNSGAGNYTSTYLVGNSCAYELSGANRGLKTSDTFLNNNPQHN